MTDHPTDPEALTGEPDPEARWFHDAVEPVVGAPIPDGWESIRARVSGEAPTVVKVGGGPTPPWRSPRLLAAAVLVAVGLAAAILVATRQDDRDVRTTVGPGTSEPTGFYLPQDLPDGWRLANPIGEVMDETKVDQCPCRLASWRAGDQRRVALQVHAPLNTDLLMTPLVRGRLSSSRQWSDAPPGVVGWSAVEKKHGLNVYAWQRGDTTTYVVARNQTRRVDIDTIVDQVGTDLSTPPGFETMHRGSIGADVRFITEVQGSFANVSTGTNVAFTLRPDPLGIASVGLDDERVIELPGTGRQVHQIAVWTGLPAGLVGAWPGGAMIELGGPIHEGATSEGVAAADLVALAASFQPVTAQQWKRYIESAPSSGNPTDIAVTREALIKPRLGDLIVRNDEPVPGEDLGSTPLTPGDLDPPAVTVPKVGVRIEPGPDGQTTADLLLRRMVAFASDPGGPVDPRLFASQVRLGLDRTRGTPVASAQLNNPATWRLSVDGYAGRAGDHSVLDDLASIDRLHARVGPTDTCRFGSSPQQPPTGPGELVVTIEPREGSFDSCLLWFAVVLTVDANGSISGINLFLWEP